jgi:hypothetical protein
MICRSKSRFLFNPFNFEKLIKIPQILLFPYCRNFNFVVFFSSTKSVHYERNHFCQLCQTTEQTAYNMHREALKFRSSQATGCIVQSKYSTSTDLNLVHAWYSWYDNKCMIQLIWQWMHDTVDMTMNAWYSWPPRKMWLI